MSSVISSIRPTSTVCANLYDTPNHDAVCAMPYSANHTKLMSTCCKEADVISYYDNCGLYCLAIDQSVADLTKCLYDNGAAWEDVFCRGNKTATATATGIVNENLASASASVIATGNDDKKDDDEKKTDSKNGGGRVICQGYVTTFGLAIAGLLLSHAMFNGMGF